MPRKPWLQPPPPGPHAKMTDDQIERARARAVAAGRRYPNLVDNMAILKLDRRRS